MSSHLHLIDETWIDRPPGAVAVQVADAGNWALWWPELELTVARDRGIKGMQWTVAGRYRGTAEIWLEPMQGGVLLHHYLRLDVVGGRPAPRQLRRLDRALAWQAKRVFWALKDDLENNR